MPVQSRRSRPRLPREDLRSMLLRTGRDLVVDEGLDVDGGTFTFKQVFDRLESDTGLRLTNASVIRRIWEDQADFQADVLAAVAAGEGVTDPRQSVDILRSRLEALDVSSSDARAKALRESCRLTGLLALDFLQQSQDWGLWIAVWATTELRFGEAQHKAGFDRIHAALSESYERATNLWNEALESILGHLGMRVRTPLTVRQFAVATGALLEGSALRRRLDDSMTGIIRSTGPDGAEEEWSIFGMGLEALVDRFFEEDPNWVQRGHLPELD
ncbi:MAG: hypothetical protein ACYDDZ_07045 [Acidimicrobiales bacterium]